MQYGNYFFFIKRMLFLATKPIEIDRLIIHEVEKIFFCTLKLKEINKKRKL